MLIYKKHVATGTIVPWGTGTTSDEEFISSSRQAYDAQQALAQQRAFQMSATIKAYRENKQREDTIALINAVNEGRIPTSPVI